MFSVFTMLRFNFMLIFTVYLYLNILIVFECESAPSKHQCGHKLSVLNGYAKFIILDGVTIAKITCHQPYVLLFGNETITCIEGKWDDDFPICAKIDPINVSCDFESPVDRFCRWTNYMSNEVDWLIDEMSVQSNSNGRHVTNGSSQYFTNHYLSLNAGNYGSTSVGRLLSPPLVPVANKQSCLQFSYKVTSGDSQNRPTLKVIFGGIPHWETHEGEGRVTIGLYRFSARNNIVIEGSNCRAAIDNLIVTEDDRCTQRPYNEEIDSCHDNCGIISNGAGCSCDWSCYKNNNCCSDIQSRCPYIKSMDDIFKLYIYTKTTDTSKTVTTTPKNDVLNLSCDFESSDETFCGWKNDIFNNTDWLADKISFVFNSRHVIPGSLKYFTNNYISLDAGNDEFTNTGRLISPPVLPVGNDQKCLIFSYRVTSGNSTGSPILKISFGGIPHWETHEGQGRAIIGLYQFNTTSRIVIEGKRCKAAIDNIVITEGNKCNKKPYVGEIESCRDNCGKISDYVGCSCDWKCHNNNNCCPDIQIKCPYIKPMDDISRLYLATTTPATRVSMMTSEKNKILNVTIIPKNGFNDTTTIINMSTLMSTDKLLNTTHYINSTLNGLRNRRSPKIVNYLNIFTFSNKNLTDTLQPNFENSLIPLKHNQNLNTNAFSFNNNNCSNLPAVTTEFINPLVNLKENENAILLYVYNTIYVIGYLVTVGAMLFILKRSYYFLKFLVKKPINVIDQAFIEKKN
ncbi:uncharacterized protein LOC112595796 [Melanaphis sacchari]|uniref:uncharacterized protein LOC112595796 n=1 Tax=Melanaphis sacchari TaxID=742174 RepID=UPI000DC13D35|nr:uncharacterized protein LOC112595796 [Melanaphis sacchari]